MSEQKVIMCEVAEELSREGGEGVGAALQAAWSMEYFAEYGQFPSPEMNKKFEKIMTALDGETLDAIVLQLAEDAGYTIEEVLQMVKEQAKEQAAKQGKKAVMKGIGKALNYLVARETVKDSIGGGVSATGRRMAVTAITRSTTRAAAQSGAVALKVVGSAGVGIVSSITEFVVSESLDNFFGVKDKRVALYAGAGAGIAAGAIAGGCIGGPVGAAAGAGVAAVGTVVGETFMALTRVGKGPAHNWAYIETVNAENICFSSWGAGDRVYATAYGNKYLGTNERDCFSAGQGVNDSFQASVYEYNSCKAHCQEAFYRDLIQAAKVNGKLVIVHCHGEVSTSPGLCEIKCLK